MDWKDPNQVRAYHRGKQREYRARNPERTKQLRREAHIKNRDRDLQANRLWYERNKEHFREMGRKWQKANPEKAAEYVRKYRKRHPEKIASYAEQHRERQNQISKEWYVKNRERHLATSRAWYRANHERAQVKWAKRRVHVHQGKDEWLTIDQWRAIKAAYKNRCAYCGKPSKKLTQDHVIPLVKGGTHTARNVVPACMLCNKRKATNGPPILPPVRLLL